MGQVSVTAQKVVHGSVEQVRTAIADYRTTRPKILTEHYSEYELRSGGQGAGTEVHWKLAATSKRTRDMLVQVTQSGDALVETDRNSSMVTRWTVAPADGGTSTVEIHTTWNGAGGIGGFFERMFAPGGLRKIYDGMLTNLDQALSS